MVHSKANAPYKLQIINIKMVSAKAYVPDELVTNTDGGFKVKMHLHKIDYRSNSQGVAEVDNISVSTLLEEVKETGQEVILRLQSGKPVDYLPNTLIWHLCSARMKELLDEYRQPEDDYQWLSVTVMYQGQRLQYFALWFPNVPDVLDQEKTLLIDGQDYVRIPVFRASAVENRSLVIFQKSDNPRLYTSELVKRMLLNADCTGMVFTPYKISGTLPKTKLPPLIKKGNKNSETFDLSKLTPMQLPDDLKNFLHLRNKLEYKDSDCIPGRIVLKSLANLELSEVWVEPLQKNDPHYGETGYYVVPAISLVHECEGYDPEFILLWLPNDGFFGTWDSDHWILKVFPGVNWQNIVNNPIPFINAQWESNSNVSQNYDLWFRYELIQGRPF